MMNETAKCESQKPLTVATETEGKGFHHLGGDGMDYGHGKTTTWWIESEIQPTR
ncbi:MAG: hypothetical protein VYB72_11180 [Planctomycetota bacterium]|nr:hypothetical protein [Planctomycetota bacterium]